MSSSRSTFVNSEEQRQLLVQHFERWHQLVAGAGTTNKPLVEDAIDKLYLRCGKQKPAIFWCQSFYQMLTLPSLVIGILHSDMWQVIAGEMERAREQTDQWDRQWQAKWPEIWLNGGFPLLDGMNRTSRIAEHYGQLEGALIAQAKRELSRQLRCGRLDPLENSLRREIYRVFWARHGVGRVWAREQADTMWNQMLEISPSLTHADSWQGWDFVSDTAGPLQELGMGIHALFDLLANRLGAEPAHQQNQILHLPGRLYWLATADLMMRTFTDQFQRFQDDLNIWLDLAYGCSAIMCLEGMIFVCEKPAAVHLTERNRLHCADGPALMYADGFAEYAWEGVIVPGWVVSAPEQITPEKIEGEPNAEVRRVMLERYGTAQYIQKSKAELVHEDDFGSLYRKQLPGDEALVMVKVVNSSPEPDGTYKDYFLRVPPTITTAKEAVAWTFGFDEEQYDPEIQT